MKNGKKGALAIVLAVVLSGIAYAGYNPVSTKSQSASADLSGIAEKLEFDIKLRRNSDNADLGSAGLTWFNAGTNPDSSPADGVIDDPGDGTMNKSKHWWAQENIELSLKVTKVVPYGIQLYTDNKGKKNPPPFLYTAKTQSKNGLVSKNGKQRLPLVWRVAKKRGAVNPILQTCDTKEPGKTPAYASKPQMCEFFEDATGFHAKGFDVHLMGDLSDSALTDFDLEDGTGWWSNPNFKGDSNAQRYHAVVLDGIAGFQELINAFQAESPLNIYVGAQFDPVSKQDYQTKMYIELYTY